MEKERIKRIKPPPEPCYIRVGSWVTLETMGVIEELAGWAKYENISEYIGLLIEIGKGIALEVREEEKWEKQQAQKKKRSGSSR